MKSTVFNGILLSAFALSAAGQPKSIETTTKIHRLESTQRSVFDAFVYVNRIPDQPEDGELPEDFAGRVYGRLANQEGRILLKLPPTMNRRAYFGFKTFLGSEGDVNVANCVSCHAPSGFSDGKSHVVEPGGPPKPTPSLRDLKLNGSDLEKVIRAKIAASTARKSGAAKDVAAAYARMDLSETDVPDLVAFLESLKDVEDGKFRDLIIKAEVFDATQPVPAPTLLPPPAPAKIYGERPNVLFIAVDDLNDWVGCLGGHPRAKTPNIDKLARKGVLFEQAHCAAPLCSPSRTAIMTGLRPSTTGIYGNLNWFRDLPQYKDWVTLPQWFRKHGYLAWGGGKLYHQAHGKFSDAGAWDHVYSTRTGALPPPVAARYAHGLRPKFESNPILARLIDWGPTDHPVEANPDWQTAEGAAQFLRRDYDQPFLLGCGIYLPHLPWYAPRQFFEMHPIEDIELPSFKPDDFDDIPSIGRRMGEEHINHIRESGKWKEAVQACLAADSFADACVGHVLNALEKSRHRDNTIVVLWGDHGYDVGEKKIAKSALWEQTTRTPLIIHVPEKLRDHSWHTATSTCKRPVSLLDLYPTLLELCGLPPNGRNEGRSIAPLVRNPEAEWPYPAVITHSPHWLGNNHAVRSERWHYIRYADGGEELYDMGGDPHQWTNLARLPETTLVKGELRRWLPATNAAHYRGADQNRKQ